MSNIYVTTQAETLALNKPESSKIFSGNAHASAGVLERPSPEHSFAEEDVQEVREHAIPETRVVLLQQIVEELRVSLLYFRLRGMESGRFMTCSGVHNTFIWIDDSLKQITDP